MADVKKIATRVSYGEALVELANEHDDFVVLDADLAAATQTGKFKAACPDRFFDVGIAESNLMGVAAGIATTGRVAFASTFAMFAAGRAFEQVRTPLATRISTSRSAPRTPVFRWARMAPRISAARISPLCALFPA